MSESEGEIKVVKRTVELKGADNYVVWKRSLGMRLATKELDEYIKKEPSVILSETLKRIVLSSPTPTAAELTKVNEATYKCHRKAITAVTTIYNSLSTMVQNCIPSKKADTDSPNPKGLYTWLEQEFGAASTNRQSELWSMVWGMDVGEGEDPTKILASIRSSFGELGTSLPSEMTAAQLIEKMSAFAMLRALPESYSLLVSTLYASPSLSSEHVLQTINREWRCRQQGQETTAAAGYLAKEKAPQPFAYKTQERRMGKDGKPQLGPHTNEYSDEHKCYGHTTN